MNLRKGVSASLYVCLSLSLFSGILLGQEAGRDGEKNSPENFEKGEGGSFQRKRMEWEYKQRAYPHKRIPPGARLNALKQLDAKLAKESEARSRAGKGASGPHSNAWTMIGPEPENNVWWGPNSGRVAAVAVDPTNTNIVYAGAAQGGVWKTTDGGVTWTPLTDQQASLATGSLAIDPQNHLTLYVGTGEENNSGDSYYGAGILKSTDGGYCEGGYRAGFGQQSGAGWRDIGNAAVHDRQSFADADEHFADQEDGGRAFVHPDGEGLESCVGRDRAVERYESDDHVREEHGSKGDDHGRRHRESGSLPGDGDESGECGLERAEFHRG